MHKRTTPKTFVRSKQLRRNLTLAEARLWSYLRGNQINQVNFRRQHAMGKYIVDFCSPKAKLIIELDGSQHLEQVEYDKVRTQYLEARGYRVIRFWNHEVMNDIDGVIHAIILAVETDTHP